MLNYKDIEKELKERYRKSYKSILSNEIIEKGIDFHSAFLKAKINQVIDDMIGEGVKIEEKKFPRGERKWCIECARRIKKELKDYKKKFNE